MPIRKAGPGKYRFEPPRRKYAGLTRARPRKSEYPKGKKSLIVQPKRKRTHPFQLVNTPIPAPRPPKKPKIYGLKSGPKKPYTGLY